MSIISLFTLSLSLYAIDVALLLRLKELSETTQTKDPELATLIHWIRQMGPEQLFMVTCLYVGLLVFARFFIAVYAILLPLQLFSIGVNVFLNGRLKN
jgi:hypothetical protein